MFWKRRLRPEGAITHLVDWARAGTALHHLSGIWCGLMENADKEWFHFLPYCKTLGTWTPDVLIAACQKQVAERGELDRSWLSKVGGWSCRRFMILLSNACLGRYICQTSLHFVMIILEFSCPRGGYGFAHERQKRWMDLTRKETFRC